MDRLTSQMSCSDLLSLSWFICLAVFGLAYYTNPSEKSFKQFLDRLPISTRYKSLRQNQNLTLRNKSKSHPNTSKSIIGHRNSKNSPNLSSNTKLSFSLQTSHYNRHNLLLCTLISIDQSQHSNQLSAQEAYPQLEWFLGCFDTWFPLQRQQLSPALDSFSTVSSNQAAQPSKSFWNLWAFNLSATLFPPPPPIDELSLSLKDLSSPLLKVRKKKTHQIHKLISSLPQISDQSNQFPQRSTFHDSFTSSTSSGSEHDCYTTEVSAPTSPREPCTTQVSAPLPLSTSPQAPSAPDPRVESCPRSKTDEKLGQSQMSPEKLIQPSVKVQEDIVAIQSKVTSIQPKLTKVTKQMKKEGERQKTTIKHTKLEIDQLAKTNVTKIVKKKPPKEKLTSRQAELNKPNSPDSKSDQTTAPRRDPILEDSEAQSSVLMCPQPSQSSTSSPIRMNEVQNIAVKPLKISATGTSPSLTCPQSPNSFTLAHSNHSMGPMLFPDLSYTHYHLDRPLAPDPWSDTIQHNYIRETFISLPNLERSALNKDHHPVLRALEIPSPPHLNSPLTDEFFNYRRHEILPPTIALTHEWTQPLSSQAPSPFGAIGQQGSPTLVPAHTSPIVHASPFYLPDTSTSGGSLICGGLLVGAGNQGPEMFSRTSSSSSLSQMPGNSSIRSSPASPYAPIGTPAYLNHGRLNELQDNSGQAIQDCCSFGGSPHDFSKVEADYGRATALGLKTSSRRLKSSNSSPVGLAEREKAEGVISTETIPEEDPLRFKKHHSTKSLGGKTPAEASGLNSIFDVVPKTALPSDARSQRPLPRPTLNPSAKVFTCSTTRPSSITRAYPSSSVGQQRARGYSHSTIPSSTTPCTRVPTGLETKAESAEQAKLRKSLHRSSWSVVVGTKAAAAGPPREPSMTRETRSSRFKEQDGSSESVNWAMDTLASNSLRSMKLTGSPSELALASSPGQALPAEFTKAPCAGLFGPIGDSKPKKSPSSQLSPSIPPPLTSRLSDFQLLSTPAAAPMTPRSLAHSAKSKAFNPSFPIDSFLTHPF